MIISIGNRKGGTGKTTTVVNLAKALVDLGKDVLVLDMDPQANLSYSLGVAVEGCLLGEVLLESKIEDEYIFNSGGIDIIPSNESLQEYELEMIRSDYSKFCLQKALNERHSDYDYILIDCPPAASYLTTVSLLASEKIIIPMLLDYLSLQGAKQMIHFVSRLNQSHAHHLKIAGALGVMVDERRKRFSREVIEELNQMAEKGLIFFDNYIRLNVQAAEAPGKGLSVIDFDKRSSSAIDYMNFATEIIHREI